MTDVTDWPEYDQMMSNPNNEPPPRVAKMMADYRAKRAKGERPSSDTKLVNIKEAAGEMGVSENEFSTSPQIQSAYMKKHGLTSMRYMRDATPEEDAEEDADLAAEEDEGGDEELPPKTF